VDESGRYQIPSLSIGSYKVELQKDGRTVATRENIAVNLGGASQVSFASGGSAATTLDAVVVTGADVPMIDVSATDVRSVFTSEQLAKIPVGRSINSIALLSPGVVQGDSRYSNVA